MMEKNTIFDEFSNNVAVWCGKNMDAMDLAGVVDCFAAQKNSVLSVPLGAVETVWPWVEGKNVKIMSRFYFPDKIISEQQISDVTAQINSSFKQGANGAQVFYHMRRWMIWLNRHM